MNEIILKKIEFLLAEKNDRPLKKELLVMTPLEIAAVINQTARGKRKLFALLPAEIQAEIILHLSKKSKKTIIAQLANLTIARFLHFMNYESDAVDILQFLSEKRQREIIKHLQPAKKILIEKLLKYDPNTAGGLMDFNFIIINGALSFQALKEEMAKYERPFSGIPAIILKKDASLTPVFLTEEKIKSEDILGYLPLQRLFYSRPEEKIKKYSCPFSLVKYDESDTELIKNIESGEKVLGVTNENDELTGIIKIEDLAKVSLREATQNLYGFAGVKREEEIFDHPLISIKMRYRWLIINLATVFLAAAVVGSFQDTISKMVLLAVYMPVVAGMGGNAGIQTLAVVIRAIALGEATLKNSLAILKKEIAAALGNGLITGAIAALAATFWNVNPGLGFILFAAMVINLVVAGFFGALIPLVLKSFKIDPALASSIFITTATDVFGFLTFLSLAKLFLV